MLAIIQARLSSTRFPKKILADIVGKPMLQRVVERVSKASTIDKVIVAVPADDYEEIQELLDTFSIDKELILFHTSVEVEDVLGRYHHALAYFPSSSFVRITSDCPLIDPQVIDDAARLFFRGNFDYILSQHFDGMDCEVISYRALNYAWKWALSSYEREHVTPYIQNRPEMFKIGRMASKVKTAIPKLSVDESSDLKLVTKIYESLGEDCQLKDILELIKTW